MHVHTFEATPGNPQALSGIGKVMYWAVHVCRSCAGVVAAGLAYDPKKRLRPGEPEHPPIAEWIVPAPHSLAESIPQRVAYYLEQAGETLTSVAASIVMSASAVDAMLKEKKYEQGSLYERIEKAAQEGVITQEMASLAHDVRLDANDQRHADLAAQNPTSLDALRCFDFAEALAEMMFVLPGRVKRAGKGSGASGK